VQNKVLFASFLRHKQVLPLSLSFVNMVNAHIRRGKPHLEQTGHFTTVAPQNFMHFNRIKTHDARKKSKKNTVSAKNITNFPNNGTFSGKNRENISCNT